MKKFLLLSLLAFFVIVQSGFGQEDTVWTLDLWPGLVNSPRFSMTGDTIVCGLDSTVQLRETATGNLIKQFAGHTAPVSHVLFTPDGKNIISGAGIYALDHNDPFIYFWDIDSGYKIKTFDAREDSTDSISNVVITSIDISSNGNYLAVTTSVDYHTMGGFASFLNLWNVSTGAKLISQKLTKGAFLSAKFSHNGNYLAFLNAVPVKMNVPSFDSITYFSSNTFTDSYIDLAISHDGTKIVTASDNGYIMLWDLTSASFTKIIYSNLSNPDFRHIVFSYDDNFIITGGGWNQITKIIDVETRQIIHIYQVPGFGTNGLDLSPNSNYIISAAGRHLLLYNAIFTNNAWEDTDDGSIDAIYPNPSTGNLNLDFNLSKDDIVNLIISDNSGKLINKMNIGFYDKGNNEYKLNVSNFNTGIYYITIQGKSFLQTYKLVKE